MKLRALGSLLLPAFLAGCLAIGCSLEPTASDSGSQAADVTEKAQDPTGLGPNQVADAEYKRPAATDPDVLGDRMTEVWAHLWRPATMNAGEKHPLLVFLHGNHGTCGTGSNPRSDDNTQYTTDGTCPDGYVVTPNHMGYAYIAERMASWGYIVVSINANRGITGGESAPGDSGLNLARGRLVLKHLQLLSQWNHDRRLPPPSLGVDLADTIDFGNIGMMGHSRGGEGVRARPSRSTKIRDRLGRARSRARSASRRSSRSDPSTARRAGCSTRTASRGTSSSRCATATFRTCRACGPFDRMLGAAQQRRHDRPRRRACLASGARTTTTSTPSGKRATRRAAKGPATSRSSRPPASPAPPSSSKPGSTR